MKKIIYQRPDGGVSVIHPVRGAADAALGDADILHRAWKDVPADAIAAREIAADALPERGPFRNAWRDDGAVAVDMPAARALHLARIRRARDKALLGLDTDMLRALGRGDGAWQAEIEAGKQALRDLPQTFDLGGATSPAELDALWPPGLERQA